MPDEEDTAADERRLFGEARDRTVAFVASSMGVTRIELAGDQVGRFSLVHDGTATSVAAGEERLVVGTESDVLLSDGEDFTPTHFGPSVAVAVADGQPLAVRPNGDVARRVGAAWEHVGSVVGPGRMDGNLLAASNGIYRVSGELTDLGRADARDVAAAGPYAATAEGLFQYDDGWTREADEECTIVAATDDRAHAVGDGELFERDEDGWVAESIPAEGPLADLAHGESLYAVTADGTMLVRADPEVTPDGRGGWRSRSLGVPDVVGLAVI